MDDIKEYIYHKFIYEYGISPQNIIKLLQNVSEILEDCDHTEEGDEINLLCDILKNEWYIK